MFGRTRVRPFNTTIRTGSPRLHHDIRDLDMHEEYHVVFTGKTLENADPKLVAAKIAKATRRDAAFVDVLLSGKTIVLKRTKNLNQANQVQHQLQKMGALAEVKVIQKEAELITTPEKPTSTSPDLSKTQRLAAIGYDEVQSSPEEASFARKFQYKFDTFMARGSSSSFKALLFVFLGSFLLIAGIRGLMHGISPDLTQQYESLDFFGNIYITFLQLTDPGNMAQDILSSSWYKIFAILSGLAGVILLSALIAVITTALDQKLAELKRGRSKVIEEGHTLIIGWDEQRIIEILRELILANESEKDACVVVLADEDKEDMDEALRMRIPDSKTTRIVTRSGKGTILTNLDMVSIEAAKSIIVLAYCSDTDTQADKVASDALVIQTVLAATTKSVKKEDYAIVAEIFNDTYRDIIENTFPEYVVTLDTGNILAKLLVQTSRSVGLSVVYSEILSFDGCEMYFHEDKWGGAKFMDIAYHFPDGVPIGVRHENGELLVNPPHEYIMQDSDEVLIVADDDSTIEYLPSPIITPKKFPPLNTRAEQQSEFELIVGWNHKTETILREFSDYVIKGSEIDLIMQNATEEERAYIKAVDEEITNIKINIIDINPLDRNSLSQLDLQKYNTIILLASSRENKLPEQVDSENIVTLLLIRSIFQEIAGSDLSPKVITEVMDSQNHSLIAKAGVKDMIISNRLVSMVTAQISESRGIKDVYDDIFQEDGSEIYLKPLSLYFDNFPVTASFADFISVAQNRNEICFGIKEKAKENDENNGVNLIPLKDEVFTLNSDDCLVVVAEDEL